MKKIAVFHNYIDNIGGAEIVTLALARNLNADVYTTKISPEHIIKMGYEDVLPRIKSIGWVPSKAPFKHQLALWRFRKLNLKRQYDFYIISGDWAMSGAVKNHPNLWYVHGPTNELWQWTNFIKEKMLSLWQKPIFDIWVRVNRIIAKSYSKKVDNWVCNSKNSQDRIKRFYNKNAVVINPPIDTSKYFNDGDDGYWLSVNRILDSKRIDVQIEAFKRLSRDDSSKKLIIVGSYEEGVKQFEGYRGKIEKMIAESGADIKIINWVTDKELKSLYANCRGFITTSMDEDFGMSIVEAMASGKPVVAPREGGYKESVIDKENGILIDDIDAEKLAEAIIKIESILVSDPNKYALPCQNRAALFDTVSFIAKIKSMIN